MLPVHVAANIRVTLLDAETLQQEASGTVEEFVEANFDDADLCDALEAWAVAGAVGDLLLGTGASPMILRAVERRP